MFVEMSDMNLLGVLSLISYLFGVLRQTSTVILIESPCFSFYAMMTEQPRPGVCPRCRTTSEKR